MADENKLRVRQGSDGNLYPYTHPNLVIDENAESVTTKINNINNTIGKKKVNAYYVLDNVTGTLTVVADNTDPFDPLTQVKLADVNGVASIGDKVNLVPEVGASGIFDYIDTAVTQAKLEGQDIDLSAYQKRIDDNLTTDDKNLINVVNDLADNSHYHESFTDAEIEAMFDGTSEEITYWESLIQDQTVSTNRIFSSQGVVDRITEALLQSQKYANDLVKNMNSMTCKVLDTKPDTGEELVLYLIGASGNYHQWMFIEGAWADLGSTNITLNGYVTEEKLTEELAKKADDDKVLKLDKITTAMSGTPSNDNVLSELAIKNLLDGKADSTSIPTVTNDLTDALKANYDAAYTHSQTTHFDGDYNNLTNLPTIPSKTSELTNDSNLLEYRKASDLGITDANDSPIGFITGRELTNAPTTDWYNYITLHFDFNPSCVNQLAFSLNDKCAYIRTKLNGTWGAWQRLCTTKVADVNQTTITTLSSYVTSGSIYYQVKNGVCYVSIVGLVIGTDATPNFILCSGLPKCASKPHHIITDGSANVTSGFLGLVYLSANGELGINLNRAGTGYCSFSYPVAES